jgi:hypothetical protein
MSLAGIALKIPPQLTKRVWTNDDFLSRNESALPTAEESASETLIKFRLLDKKELGAAVLRRGKAPNVEFSDRNSWEQKLFEAKRVWLDQIDRMMAHKESNKYLLASETALAEKAHDSFERIAEEGMESARAENNPKLKAQLHYKRQLESCNRSTGDFRAICLSRLAQLKFQMGQDGQW